MPKNTFRLDTAKALVATALDQAAHAAARGAASPA